MGSNPNGYKNLMGISEMAHPELTPVGRGHVESPHDGLLVQLPVLDFPPNASWPIIPNGAVTVPAIGQSVTVCQQQVPKGYSAVIYRLANGTALNGASSGIAGWVNGDGTLLWRMLHNNASYQYFNDLSIIWGLTENGGSPLMAPLRGYETETLSLVLFNINCPATGQPTVGSFSGWIYPKNLDPTKRR